MTVEPIVDIVLKSGHTLTIKEDLTQIDVPYTYEFFNKVIKRLKDLSTGSTVDPGYFTYSNTFVLISDISAIVFSEGFLEEISAQKLLLNLSKDASFECEDINMAKHKSIPIEFK